VLSFLRKQVVGKLSDIDKEANIVHVHIYYYRNDILVPLCSVKNEIRAFLSSSKFWLVYLLKKQAIIPFE
jgi:hypothetical protein